MSRRRDPVVALAILGLLVGLTVAGIWAWRTYGTSWLANRDEAAVLNAFTEENPLPEQVAPALRADVENSPVTTGDGVLGTLWVPSWAGEVGVHGDVNDGRTPIKEGVTQTVLSSGAAGRFPQGQHVGEVGNVALAGHRRTHGDNFLHIDDLQVGDVIVVETPDAWFVYEVVVTAYLVRPTDGAGVVGPAPHGLPEGGRYLTLVSCHSITDGEWGNDQRMVVHGKEIGWLPRAAGLPPQLASLGR